MALLVDCPHCNRINQVLEHHVGKEIVCFSCGSRHVAGYVPFGHQGRYLLDRHLRTGGMGFVFKAFDTAMQRNVAIKVPICLDRADDPGRARERFKTEIKALLFLNHASINAITDHGEWKDYLFFAMPFLSKGTLAERLASGTLPGMEDVVEWVRTVAKAMDYAHQIGVVHRDLKPSNLMFEGESGSERIVVTDFGLALIMGDTRITLDGTVLGTPPYMSPEQVGGRVDRQGPKSDVYSLGVILFEVITGRLPFLGRGEELRRSILRDDPPRPITLRSEIPQRLEEICLKAMARSIRDRYASMREFARDLGTYLGRESRQPVVSPEMLRGTSRPTISHRGRLGIEMVQIQPGEFLMGSEESEDERPTRRVRLESSFLLGRYPVTQSLYKVVVGRLPLSRFNGQDRNPVDSVSWFDAVRFCNLLSAVDSLEPYYGIESDGTVEILGDSGYRLPTEAEWEYACRAGSTALYCFGDNVARLGEFAWYDENSQSSTQPVGQKQANAFHLHDMHGNVWEWCWDRYDFYEPATSRAGEVIVDPTGPAKGPQRVLRGGCFRTDANQVRCATRNPYDPDQGLYYFGFRLARSLL
jgi:eukaryotic-like serine/threonine-protein kinase